MGDENQSALRTAALSKTFGRRTVLHSIDLEVPRGTIYGFLGQNGAGKTTTMRMLLGLIRPSGGSIALLDEAVVENGQPRPSSRLAAARRLGALVESPAFYPFLSGRKNLALFGRLLGVRDDARVEDMLARVGLAGRGDDLFRVYSRGMKQRLGLAAALIHEPELVLLDEPMSGLDPPGVVHMRELLRDLAKTGITIFLSSHLLNDAEQLCSHVGILHEGKLVAQGLLEDLCREDEALFELRVDDGPRAMELLATRPEVKERRQLDDGGGLELRLDHGAIASVNKALVDEGLSVRAIIPRKRTLENVFLTRTQAEKAS